MEVAGLATIVYGNRTIGAGPAVIVPMVTLVSLVELAGVLQPSLASAATLVRCLQVIPQTDIIVSLPKKRNMYFPYLC